MGHPVHKHTRAWGARYLHYVVEASAGCDGCHSGAVENAFHAFFGHEDSVQEVRPLGG